MAVVVVVVVVGVLMVGVDILVCDGCGEYELYDRTGKVGRCVVSVE